jgi:hypothetical protein
MSPPIHMRFTVIMLAFIASMGALQAREVVLRNKDGNSLTARLVSISGDKLAVMRESDNKQFMLDLTQLDDASRGKVDDWVKAGGNQSERYEIEFSSGKSGKKSPYENYDDRLVSMEPVVVVKNPDIKVPTKPAKVTALILGRPIKESGGYYVFSTETFVLPVLEGGRQKAFTMKKFSHTYDSRGSAKYGSRYLGWVVYVHDAEDNRIIHSQSVPATLAAKFGAKFLTLKSGCYYDSDLEIIKYGNYYPN